MTILSRRTSLLIAGFFICITPLILPASAADRFNNTERWSYFDLATVNAGLKGYSLGDANGNLVYYAPYRNPAGYSGMAVRYDTTRIFTDAGSWEYMDLTTVNAGLKGFTNAVAHGNYVYYIPFLSAGGVFSGKTVRFDTTKTFTDTGSWELFDLATIDARLKGFTAGMSEGNYVYYVPFQSGVGVYSGVTARFDTTKPFPNAGSWEFYDLTTIDARLKGFNQGIAVCDFAYYVPYMNGAGSSHGMAIRYDTTKPFGNAGSWEFYDLTTIDAGLKGFTGAASSGNHVYYIPRNNGAPSGLTVRYNTTKPFANAGSWEIFDIATVDAALKGFVGGVARGSYVYYIPNNNGAAQGNAVRYDTTKPFADVGSWEYFNLTRMNADLKGFQGAIVVGDAIHYVPYNNGAAYVGVTARYDASPAPVASFTGTPLSGTAPLTVAFTDTSSGSPDTWSWDFGDGSTSVDQHSSHAYTAAGTYTVTLTSSQFGEGSTSTRTGYITASAPPAQTGSSGGSSSPPAFAGAGSRLKAGEPTTLRFLKDSTVRWIDVVPVRDLAEVMVVVTDGVDLPKHLAVPEGVLLGTFEATLYHAEPGDLGGVTMRFRIPASKLAGTGLSPGDVVLLRAGDTGWDELPTEYLGVSEGFLSYQATLPGFSTFAIVGVPGRAANLTATQETTPMEITTTRLPTTVVTLTTVRTLPPVTGTTPVPPAATPAHGIPLSSAALTIALAIPVLFRKR